VLPGDANDSFRGRLDLGHCLRGQQDDDGIDAGVLKRGLQRFLVTIGAGISQDINRVVVVGGRREHLAQAVDRFGQ